MNGSSQNVPNCDRKAGEELPLSLSDKLALERTKLANRRTLLAYFRTALAVLVAGGGMSELLHSEVYHLISDIMLIAVPVLVVFGVFRFFHTEAKWHSVWK